MTWPAGYWWENDCGCEGWLDPSSKANSRFNPCEEHKKMSDTLGDRPFNVELYEKFFQIADEQVKTVGFPQDATTYKAWVAGFAVARAEAYAAEAVQAERQRIQLALDKLEVGFEDLTWDKVQAIVGVRR